MRSKPHTEIKSLSPTFVQQLTEEFGAPDNFVESAEATFTELPSLDSDPSAREVVNRLEQARDQIVQDRLTTQHDERQANGEVPPGPSDDPE